MLRMLHANFVTLVYFVHHHSFCRVSIPTAHKDKYFMNEKQNIGLMNPQISPLRSQFIVSLLLLWEIITERKEKERKRKKMWNNYLFGSVDNVASHNNRNSGHVYTCEIKILFQSYNMTCMFIMSYDYSINLFNSQTISIFLKFDWLSEPYVASSLGHLYSYTPLQHNANNCFHVLVYKTACLSMEISPHNMLNKQNNLINVKWR